MCSCTLFAHTNLCWPWSDATWCVIWQVNVFCILFSHMYLALQFSYSSTQTWQFTFLIFTTSMLGAHGRFLDGVSVYQLLLLLHLPSYICFCNTELFAVL
jgi:hypothetical protein